MPLIFKILKAGKAAGAGTTVSYTVGASTSAIATSIRLYGSGGAATGTVNVKTTTAATAALVGSFTAGSASTNEYKTELTLQTGAVLEVVVSGNTADVLVCGVERPV